MTGIDTIYGLGVLLSTVREQNPPHRREQLFVSSIYCFLNHHTTNDYVIDLDNIWPWLGFSQKDAAKRVLEKNFTEGSDYKCLLHKALEQRIGRVGQYNTNNELVREFSCKYECMKHIKMSDKTLAKALDNHVLYNNHYYRHLGSKVVC